MGRDAQTTSHQGLRAWFEVLRAERNGHLPRYWVREPYDSVHCSHPDCTRLTASELSPTSWEERLRDGTLYLFAFRHGGRCPWMQHVDDMSQNGFTTKPLERAYVYWAQLKHKLNHK